MPFFHISPKMIVLMIVVASTIYPESTGPGKALFSPIFDLLESKLRTAHCISFTIKSVLSLEIFQKVFFRYAIQQSFTKQHAFIHSVFEHIFYKCQQLSPTWNICGFVHLWGKVITFHTLWNQLFTGINCHVTYTL